MTLEALLMTIIYTSIVKMHPFTDNAIAGIFKYPAHCNHSEAFTNQELEQHLDF